MKVTVRVKHGLLTIRTSAHRAQVAIGQCPTFSNAWIRCVLLLDSYVSMHGTDEEKRDPIRIDAQAFDDAEGQWLKELAAVR